MDEQEKKNNSNAVKCFLSSMDLELTVYDHLLNAISDSQKHKWSSDVLRTLFMEIEKQYQDKEG